VTLTKDYIIDNIHKNSGLKRRQSAQTVETLLEIIKKTLEKGEDVMISGFGKFCIKEKSERIGRNPKTGDELNLRARKVVTFRCSPVLREKIDRRSDPSPMANQYSSVEFAISSSEPAYQFRIQDVSSTKIGILVKESSAVLKHLRVGDTLNMKYYPVKSSEHPKYLETRIEHITKDEKGRFRGHNLVGLSVLEKR